MISGASSPLTTRKVPTRSSPASILCSAPPRCILPLSASHSRCAERVALRSSAAFALSRQCTAKPLGGISGILSAGSSDRLHWWTLVDSYPSTAAIGSACNHSSTTSRDSALTTWQLPTTNGSASRIISMGGVASPCSSTISSSAFSAASSSSSDIASAYCSSGFSSLSSNVSTHNAYCARHIVMPGARSLTLPSSSSPSSPRNQS
mmetsp:Transcript_63504/g.141627  ORF Transcript_63504/g.141627 Transcript_63504/m.141627 type:complete len:206 (+) Transcript_63504:708-1325(+)